MSTSASQESASSQPAAGQVAPRRSDEGRVASRAVQLKRSLAGRSFEEQEAMLAPEGDDGGQASLDAAPVQRQVSSGASGAPGAAVQRYVPYDDEGGAAPTTEDGTGGAGPGTDTSQSGGASSQGDGAKTPAAPGGGGSDLAVEVQVGDRKVSTDGNSICYAEEKSLLPKNLEKNVPFMIGGVPCFVNIKPVAKLVKSACVGAPGAEAKGSVDFGGELRLGVGKKGILNIFGQADLMASLPLAIKATPKGELYIEGAAPIEATIKAGIEVLAAEASVTLAKLPITTINFGRWSLASGGATPDLTQGPAIDAAIAAIQREVEKLIDDIEAQLVALATAGADLLGAFMGRPITPALFAAIDEVSPGFSKRMADRGIVPGHGIEALVDTLSGGLLTEERKQREAEARAEAELEESNRETVTEPLPEILIKHEMSGYAPRYGEAEAQKDRALKLAAARPGLDAARQRASDAAGKANSLGPARMSAAAKPKYDQGYTVNAQANLAYQRLEREAASPLPKGVAPLDAEAVVKMYDTAAQHFAEGDAL